MTRSERYPKRSIRTIIRDDHVMAGRGIAPFYCLTAAEQGLIEDTPLWSVNDGIPVSGFWDVVYSTVYVNGGPETPDPDPDEADLCDRVQAGDR